MVNYCTDTKFRLVTAISPQADVLYCKITTPAEHLFKDNVVSWYQKGKLIILGFNEAGNDGYQWHQTKSNVTFQQQMVRNFMLMANSHC